MALAMGMALAAVLMRMVLMILRILVVMMLVGVDSSVRMGMGVAMHGFIMIKMHCNILPDQLLQISVQYYIGTALFCKVHKGVSEPPVGDKISTFAQNLVFFSVAYPVQL